MNKDNVERIETYTSEEELLNAFDKAKSSKKCVAIIWIQSDNNSKLFWIIKENILSLDDDGMALLIEIYSQIFGFDEDWTSENV